MRSILSLSTFAALLLLGCGEDTTAPRPAAVPAPAPEMALVSSGSWVTKADYPIGIWGATSASITNATTLRSTLFVIGGRTKQAPVGNGSITAAVRAYDVSANTWQKRAPYPRPIFYTNGAVAINNKVYVPGGFSRVWDAAAGVYRLETLAALYVYNPSLNQWTRKRDMPRPSVNGVSGVYQGNLYVATSCSDTYYCNNDFERGVLFRYTPSTDRWTLLGRTPHDPWGAAGGFIGTKFYIANALAAYGMDIYDVATGNWTTGPQRPFRFCSNTAYTTFKAKLYLSGCHAESDYSGVYPMLVYDPAVNTWTQRAAPPPRSDFGTLSRVTLTSGQVRLELVGGARPGNNLQYSP